MMAIRRGTKLDQTKSLLLWVPVAWGRFIAPAIPC
jgi:hypothetical protein